MTTRRQRGFLTEELLAKRWRLLGIFEDAEASVRGNRGQDVRNTPGFHVEVKARGNVTLPTQLKKLRVAIHLAGGALPIPVIVWRHNGQGEEKQGDWTVTLSLYDFERLVVRSQRMKRLEAERAFLDDPLNLARREAAQETLRKLREGTADYD